MSDAIQRQWFTLHLLPRYPLTITITNIYNRLKNEGYDVSRRTVERDMESLALIFPIISNEECRPYGWSWAKDKTIELPGMDPKTAMTFYLASQYLEQMFPRSQIANLRPWFDRAKNCLEQIRGPVSHWTDKIAFVAKGMPMLPATVNDAATDTIYDAIFNEKQFEARYRTRKKEISSYRVSPRGLIMRAGVVYIVATLRDYTDVIMLSLHRFVSAKPTDLDITPLPNFSLQDYISSGALNILLCNNEIEIVLRCTPDSIRHLEDTPLCHNQTLTMLDDGRCELKATVLDTMDLRWWILSQGDCVEVVEPTELREKIIATFQQSLARYQVTKKTTGTKLD